MCCVGHVDKKDSFSTLKEHRYCEHGVRNAIGGFRPRLGKQRLEQFLSAWAFVRDLSQGSGL